MMMIGGSLGTGGPRWKIRTNCNGRGNRNNSQPKSLSLPSQNNNNNTNDDNNNKKNTPGTRGGRVGVLQARGGRRVGDYWHDWLWQMRFCL